MVPVGVAQAKIAYIRRRTGAWPRGSRCGLAARGYMQTLLSRGVVAWRPSSKRSPQRSRMVAGARRDPSGKHGGVALDLDAFVHREYPNLRCSRGIFIDHRIDRSYLWVERRVHTVSVRPSRAMWPPAARAGAC